MTFALIEVQAMAKKAARGAGYSWGMAEEAAMATRWLSTHDVDGVAALAGVLVEVDSADLRQMAPGALSGDWSGKAGRLCPLMTGAALSGAAFDWADTGKRVDNLLCPILLLPFAAMASRALKAPVMVEWDGLRATTDGSRVELPAAAGVERIATAGRVTVRRGGRLDHARPPISRASPTEDDWAVLTRFAARTHAPDTEDSRLKGAGAGLTNND